MNLISVVLICFALSLSAAMALGPPTTCIMASGKIVTAVPGQKPPWVNDVIKMVRPDYPYGERAKYHQGSGLFRVTVDAKTGFVANVVAMKSTGYAGLDGSMITALRQWRLKAGTWKQFEIPVTFTMVRNRAEALAKDARI